jgi:16S rRNA C967 or C1407 C5-methylase (RsmB/RsmF family)
LDLQNLQELSRKYLFSVDVLEELSELYGLQLKDAVQALKNPSSKYYFRVNTLKTIPKMVIEGFKARGIKVFQESAIPEALYFLINDLNPVSATDYSIEVDKNTAESVLLGAHVYAPGVTKCAGLRLGAKVTITDKYGQTVGVGTAKMNETQVLSLRRGLVVENVFPRYLIPSVREGPEFSGGLIYPQSLPSILTNHVLAPSPSDTVVDLCASPGGKTTHLAQLMENRGTILSVDRSKEKVDRIRETVQRLGVRNVTLLCHDSRYIDRDYPDLKADRVLVDPPCSALGLRPKTYEETTMIDIKKLANYQRQFLKASSKITKRGGKVAYSVCTFTREECEENTRFASEECELELVKQPIILGSPGIERFYSKANLAQRFHPHIHDTTGFYIALFVKT